MLVPPVKFEVEIVRGRGLRVELHLRLVSHGAEVLRAEVGAVEVIEAHHLAIGSREEDLGHERTRRGDAVLDRPLRSVGRHHVSFPSSSEALELFECGFGAEPVRGERETEACWKGENRDYCGLGSVHGPSPFPT